MSCQVHVINDEDAARTEGSDRLAQLEDLPAGCIGKYQIELAETAHGLGPVTGLETDPWWPWSRAGYLLHFVVKLHGDDLDVGALPEPVNQPGESDADARADLKDSTAFGYRRR